MVLTRKAVGTIVVALVVALGGLITIQAILLNRAFQSEQQAFQRNAQAALGAAISRLETMDVAQAAINVVGSSDDSSELSIMMLTGDFGGDSSSRQGICSVDAVLDQPHGSHDGARYIRVVDTNSVVDTIRLGPDGSLLGVLGNTPSLDRQGDSQTVAVDWRERRITADLETDSGDVQYMLRIVQQLVTGESRPIQERLDAALVDSVISTSLQEADIFQPYRFEIVTRTTDSAIIAGGEATGAPSETTYRARLFPNDLFSDWYDLVLDLPDQQAYVWWRLAPMLVLSGLFSLVIVFCFAYTVRVIIEQRRGTSLMIDFVNNLTHEFKTPISTVALACEAIDRDDVAGDPEKVRRFSSVIVHENRRMRHQAEKILQIATIEKGDWELKLEPIEINPLVRKAVDSYELPVRERGGSITIDLQASDPVVTGDAVHLANAVHNLIDNGVKYSKEQPIIEVRSFDHFNGVQIEIGDRGIGIPNEDQKRVFEKYYRVPSGNIHDVKGFGLGLSYVKMIVERHGGTISLHSAPDKGTRVAIWLPTTMRESEAGG